MLAFGGLRSATAQTYAGIRVSSIPFSPFPAPPFFIETANCMTTKAANSSPCLVWIVSLYWSNGDIGLNFPNTTGQSHPHMNFSGTDKNEAHLDAFDAAGVNVWLQVEPGDASMVDLIDIVLARYSHHPSVIGFGVDVEWFNPTVVSSGRAVTDAEAQTWVARVKSHDPSYRLFLKHFTRSKMPPTVRGDILFVDDSQGFSSLNSMVNEFKVWGNQFSPADVAFQFGYPDDRPWWNTYADPAGTLTSALQAAVPNAKGFFWVDFTIEEIVPLGDPPAISDQPEDRMVAPGANATFTVGTLDTGDLQFAWFRNGAAISEGGHFSGATTATLSITNVDASVMGGYECAITNGCGTTSSAEARLAIAAPGDYDSDGDVDMADLQELTFCLQGPQALINPGHFCLAGDANGDRHIDLSDFASFQRMFTNP
jgi:hypothetical protein